MGVGSSLSCGPEDAIQVVRLDRKCLYPLSHRAFLLRHSLKNNFLLKFAGKLVNFQQ